MPHPQKIRDFRTKDQEIQEIEIDCEGIGKLTVQVLFRSGNFAVHVELNRQMKETGYYTVTLIPTGRRLSHNLPFQDACQLAQELELSGLLKGVKSIQDVAQLPDGKREEIVQLINQYHSWRNRFISCVRSK